MLYSGLTFLKYGFFVVVFGVVFGRSKKFKQEGNFFHFFYFKKTYFKLASLLFAYLKSILKYKYKNLKAIHSLRYSNPTFRNLSLYNMKYKQSLGTEMIISALLRSKHWNSSQYLILRDCLNMLNKMKCSLAFTNQIYKWQRKSFDII